MGLSEYFAACGMRVPPSASTYGYLPIACACSWQVNERTDVLVSSLDEQLSQESFTCRVRARQCKHWILCVLLRKFTACMLHGLHASQQMQAHVQPD